MKQYSMIRMNVHHTRPFMNVQEDILWSHNTLGCMSPICLQRAVFYYTGKPFAFGVERSKGAWVPLSFCVFLLATIIYNFI